MVAIVMPPQPCGTNKPINYAPNWRKSKGILMRERLWMAASGVWGRVGDVAWDLAEWCGIRAKRLQHRRESRHG
jgi:hypothetical protein